jgi:Fe-S-cluster containining protein
MDDMIYAFQKLHDFQRGFDDAARKLEEIIGCSICVSGCAKCCQNTVTCMTIETMNAVSVILGDARYPKLISIAEGWLLEHHRVAPTYEGMLIGKFTPPNIREEFIALSTLTCPFLLENKTCVIYDARPMVCQAFGVTRAGVNICTRPHGKGETMTQLMYMQGGALHDDIHNFKEKYKKTRPDWVTFGFFPTLLYRCAKEKEFRRMVEDNRIATAKLIGTQLDTTLMWQPQIEAMQAGASADMLSAMS